MPVTSITYQPATGQLIAAYRPIVFKVQATATGGGVTPPFVVCDIYLADVYYKSLIRTAPDSIESTYSVFQFNISDALQEYLAADLATINNNDILKAPHTSAKVFCRFRSSDVDSDGFTVEEPTVPVQGTKFESPVAGTGTQSNTFFAINSALQHEDNQNLALHLAAYKQGAWASNAFPLTHRNRYYFCNNDSDHFPMIFTGDCVSADILLHYRLKGETSFTQVTAQDVNVCPAIGFTPSVTGNRVDVHMDTALPTGQTIMAQYKKQADSVWITAGNYANQDFFFYVNGDNIAGDYDIRVITFCTPCLSSDPETDTFTLSGSVINVAWRGIDPFCVQQTLPQTIYYQLELRNPVTDTIYFPNNIDPLEKTDTTTQELYAKFYSDSNLLNPLSLTIDGLKVYVKKQTDVNFSPVTNHWVTETVNTYIVDVNGDEVKLADVITQQNSESYNPIGFSSFSYTYSPYPGNELVGGNTGEKGYTTLQEYNTTTNIPTGNTKPNDSGDPDYIAPIPDTASCPNGPNITSVRYDDSMEVFGVRVYYNDTSVLRHISPYSANTYGGGWEYVYDVPKNTNITVSVRARAFEPGFIIKVRVLFINSNGDEQYNDFQVPNNIDTMLPGMWTNIKEVRLQKIFP
jgi:hypothetical protein